MFFRIARKKIEKNQGHPKSMHGQKAKTVGVKVSYNHREIELKKFNRGINGGVCRSKIFPFVFRKYFLV